MDYVLDVSMNIWLPTLLIIAIYYFAVKNKTRKTFKYLASVLILLVVFVALRSDLRVKNDISVNLRYKEHVVPPQKVVPATVIQDSFEERKQDIRDLFKY